MVRTAWFLSALASFACAAAPATQGKKPAPSVAVTSAPATPGQARARKPPPGLAFGGERWGFVEASSVNGRLVVLRRFQGSVAPTFHQHGESSVATDVAVFDTVHGIERAVEELIEIDSKRRWLLVLAKGLLLGDSETGEFVELSGADQDADTNQCLAPRQGTFSVDGSRVAWIAKGSRELRVRELGSGQEWNVRGDSRIWRGFPDDDGRGAILLEVPAKSTGWPVQNTSCACRWCTRFAASFGFYGWSGPPFTITHVDEAGNRAGGGEPPSSDAPSHGPTDARCELKAAGIEESRVERGPWRWQCP
jgi:hypothetical protein